MHIHYQVLPAKKVYGSAKIKRELDYLSYAEFVATRRYSDDISWDLILDDSAAMAAGYIYADKYYIQQLADGSYFLITDQGDFTSRYLMELETILFSNYLYM